MVFPHWPVGKSQVLINQKQAGRLLFLLGNRKRIRNIAAWQTLSLSYGRCIAEFLDEESLVHLGLLALSTCVGLRYGRRKSRVNKLFLSLCPQESPPKGGFHSSP